MEFERFCVVCVVLSVSVGYLCFLISDTTSPAPAPDAIVQICPSSIALEIKPSGSAEQFVLRLDSRADCLNWCRWLSPFATVDASGLDRPARPTSGPPSRQPQASPLANSGPSAAGRGAALLKSPGSPVDAAPKASSPASVGGSSGTSAANSGVIAPPQAASYGLTAGTRPRTSGSVASGVSDTGTTESSFAAPMAGASFPNQLVLVVRHAKLSRKNLPNFPLR